MAIQSRNDAYSDGFLPDATGDPVETFNINEKE